MYEVEIQNIVSEILSENCVIFVGAGLSRAAGLPDWAGVISLLANDLGCSLDYDHLTIAQAYEYRFKRSTLEKKLYELLDSSNKDLSPIHNLLPLLNINFWITTNYDNLLERSLKKVDYDPCIVVQDSHIPDISDRSNTIVKIHGDISVENTIVITKNDYFKAALTKKLIWDKLRTILAEKTLLFLGYSMNDLDFNQLQAQLLFQVYPNKPRKSYAVLFDVDEIVRADLSSRNVTIIDLTPISGFDKTEALCNFLKRVINSLRIFPVIPSKYRWGEEAKSAVPQKVQKNLHNLGYRLICCVEYHVYCSLVDQPYTIPSGWKAWVPMEFKSSEYNCIEYIRWDEAMLNRWDGIAIGQSS